MQSLETRSSGLRPKSFETESSLETFETETRQKGLETRFESETKSRDPSLPTTHSCKVDKFGVFNQ